jgi:peptide/nickel transport system permease protein
VGVVLALLVLALTAIGPFVTPMSPAEFAGRPFLPAGPRFLLGTDVLGRDVLSRVLAGGYRIIGLSLAATTLGVAAGRLMGIAAGYAKGFADEFVMRTVDVAMAFPQIILARLFVSIIGPELWLIVLIVAVRHAPQVARVARAATLRVAEEDYVRYAEAQGASFATIVGREILPNILMPTGVELGLRFSYSIGLIAGLNFLGLGTQPPTPDWGLMINENRIGMATNPYGVVVPVLLIAMLTIGINLVIDVVARGGDTPKASAPSVAVGSEEASA